MIKQYTLFILFNFILGAFTLNGQSIKIESSLDTSWILIGAQTQYQVKVTKPNETEVSFPLILDTLSSGVEVLAIQIDSSNLDDQHKELLLSCTITSFDSGLQYIHPLPILAKSKGKIDTLFANPLALDVRWVPVDTSQAIMPIKGLENTPLSFAEIKYWVYGGLLLLVLAGLIYWFWKKQQKRPKQQVEIFVPKEPAHVIALRALDALKDEKLWQSGKIKAYHSTLTDILRQYIEHRFEIQAVEQTSDEIFDSFKNSGLSKQVPFEALQQLFFLSDMVKFAKSKPKPDENARSLDQAYDFVQKTFKRNVEQPENVK